MENNFDKIFKDKLENRKFEMKPEYWAGAEALIEADEKSGNWRRFLVWFGVALVAGLGIFFIWKNENANPIVEKGTVSNTTLENDLAATKEKENNEFDLLKNKISNENISTDGNQSTIKSENNNSENALVESVEGNKNANNNFSDSKNSSQLNQSSNQSSNQFSQKNLSNKSGNNFEDKNTTSKKDNYNNTLTSDLGNYNNTPTFIPNGENAQEEELNNSILDTAATKKEQVVIPTLPKEIPAVIIEKEEVKAAQPIASTSTILLPFLEMFLASSKKIEKLDLEAVCPFAPERKKFVFGGFAGAIGYPAENNSEQTPFIGFKTGLLAEYNFEIGKAKMAMGTELAYHYRAGNFVVTKQNEVATYSFGRSVAQAKLTPENLHYLELPIYLKYQKKKMSFETGISFSYLLGVKGKVTEADGTVESGWVPSLGFKNNYVNVLLGFHYQLSNNLYFGLRANYTPGGILDKNAILPQGIEVALQESKPFYVTFRLTQYLNFKK